MKLTAEKAASEFQVDRRTLRRRLEAAKLPTGRGEEYTIAQIHNALSGHDADVLAKIDVERLRLLTAQSERIEIEVAASNQELVPTANVLEIWGSVIVSLRSLIWNCDAPEADRRRWLVEIQTALREEYFKEKKPVEQTED